MAPSDNPACPFDSFRSVLRAKFAIQVIDSGMASNLGKPTSKGIRMLTRGVRSDRTEDSDHDFLNGIWNFLLPKSTRAGHPFKNGMIRLTKLRPSQLVMRTFESHEEAQSGVRGRVHPVVLGRLHSITSADGSVPKGETDREPIQCSHFLLSRRGIDLTEKTPKTEESNSRFSNFVLFMGRLERRRKDLPYRKRLVLLVWSLVCSSLPA